MFDKKEFINNRIKNKRKLINVYMELEDDFIEKLDEIKAKCSVAIVELEALLKKQEEERRNN